MADGPAVAERLSALADAAALVRRHLLTDAHTDREVLPAALARADAVAAQGRERLRHGQDHTVVALAGTTGSGKSSLLNAVAGAEIARAGLTRPTTAVTQAATFGTDAGALLDWLQIGRRHRVDDGDPALDGLVLLDLPDFDSVEMAHRLEVDRLVELVDLLVWVTDPQKYADDAWHRGYLQPYAGHGDVMAVLLNKADTLSPSDRERCVADLAHLLDADGLGQVDPMAVSARTQDGVAAVVGLLAGEVQARQVMLARIDADLRAGARELATAAGLARPDGTVAAPPTAELVLDDLVSHLGRAVGVDDVAAAVAAQHRRAAASRSGWPLLRVVARWRRDPRLGVVVAGRSPVARAEISAALRQAGEELASSVAADGPWADAVRELARERVEPVTQALDRHTLHALDTTTTTPRWWAFVGRLQGLLQTVAIVSLVWLIALATSSSLLRIDLDLLELQVRGVPLPTLLLLGSLVLGLLTRAVARFLAARGAARRARAVTTQLRRDIAVVAEAEVGDPLELMGADRGTVADLLAQAAGR